MCVKSQFQKVKYFIIPFIWSSEKEKNKSDGEEISGC